MTYHDSKRMIRPKRELFLKKIVRDTGRYTVSKEYIKIQRYRKD